MTKKQNKYLTEHFTFAEVERISLQTNIYKDRDDEKKSETKLAFWNSQQTAYTSPQKPSNMLKRTNNRLLTLVFFFFLSTVPHTHTHALAHWRWVATNPLRQFYACFHNAISNINIIIIIFSFFFCIWFCFTKLSHLDFGLIPSLETFIYLYVQKFQSAFFRSFEIDTVKVVAADFLFVEFHRAMHVTTQRL